MHITTTRPRFLVFSRKLPHLQNYLSLQEDVKADAQRRGGRLSDVILLFLRFNKAYQEASSSSELSSLSNQWKSQKRREAIGEAGHSESAIALLVFF